MQLPGYFDGLNQSGELLPTDRDVLVLEDPPKVNIKIIWYAITDNCQIVLMFRYLVTKITCIVLNWVISDLEFISYVCETKKHYIKLQIIFFEMNNLINSNFISRVVAFFSKPRVMFLIIVLVALVTTIQQYYLNEINNYLIFKFSFIHLIEAKNIYVLFPADHWDNYKYGPFFSLLIAPSALLPDILGLGLWMLINAVVLFFAIWFLPIDNTKKVFVFWFVFIEYITAATNVQANPLITALFIFAYIFFERNLVFWAALPIAMGGFIKLYPLLAGAMFLLYPNKIKFCLSFLFWCIVLFLLPLFFTSYDNLIYLYKEWYNALVVKVGEHDDISFPAILEKVISPEIKNMQVLGAGILLFLTSYINYKHLSHPEYRKLFICSILIWAVIFSPGSESATYVIAVSGVAIWYTTYNQAKPLWLLLLMGFVFIFTILSPTDLFPKFINSNFIVPYKLKALPCTICWFVIWYQLTFRKFHSQSS